MLIRLLKSEEYKTFRNGVQKAFQEGYERYFGVTNDIIIPFEDIDSSYNTKGAKTYVAIENDKIIGGAIVVINDNNENDLHILYADSNRQSKGVGMELWNYIEKDNPQTKIWRTCTPYFDERNIHFYVNKCHFHIVEFMNKYHPDPNSSDEFIGDHGEGMFEFEKIMK